MDNFAFLRYFLESFNEKKDDMAVFFLQGTEHTVELGVCGKDALYITFHFLLAYLKILDGRNYNTTRPRSLGFHYSYKDSKTKHLVSIFCIVLDSPLKTYSFPHSLDLVPVHQIESGPKEKANH